MTGIDEPVIDVKLPLCTMSFLSSPEDGECEIAIPGNNNCLPPLVPADVICEGWSTKCIGVASEMTTQIFKLSESDTASLIALDNPSTDFTNTFLVPDSKINIVVRICNGEVCTITDALKVEICDQNGEERDDAIENVLDNVGKSLEEDKLETAITITIGCE
mmetsp:Transcript_16218/g.25211  ORF Transcript_16218/g.25211 Transcript_16218/m.25211 type:complete len:162 (-) Transcript_16218:1171-1656(-)